MSGISATEVWNDVLEVLKKNLPRPTFETWLKNTVGLSCEGDIFTVLVPSTLAEEWLERRMFHALQKGLTDISGQALTLEFQVENPAETAEELLDDGELLTDRQEPDGYPPNKRAISVGLNMPMVPPFPDEAFTGLFGAYRDVVGPTTEASANYHYFAFALVFGATLGRRLYVHHADKLFPNFYVVLVGRSGLARKDSTRTRAIRLLSELHHQDVNYPDNSDVLLQPGIGSAEALVECLEGEGKVVVLHGGELLTLTAKARKESTGALLPQLTELYDSPEHHTLRTRSNPITARRAFLSVLTASTPRWLKSAVTEDDAYGGFGSRVIFVVGDPKSPMPVPPRVDIGRWDELKERIIAVRDWAEGEERELPTSSGAIGLFSEWYGSYYAKAASDGLLPALAVRFQSFAWKLALLYAAQEQAPEIKAHHLKPGLAVCDWLWDSNSAAFASIVQHGRELDAAVLDRLKSSKNGFLSHRDLYRALGVSANEISRSIESLVKLGMIQEVELPSGATRRVIKGYQLLE